AAEKNVPQTLSSIAALKPATIVRPWSDEGGLFLGPGQGHAWPLPDQRRQLRGAAACRRASTPVKGPLGSHSSATSDSWIARSTICAAGRRIYRPRPRSAVGSSLRFLPSRPCFQPG